MGLREPDCPTSGPFSHTSPLSPPQKHPNLQRAEDVDALLLGMASQIAEREDYVVVEDVRGEAEAVPAGYAALAPGKKFSGSSRTRQRGMPGWGDRVWETCTLSLLTELLTCRPQIPLCGYGWRPRAGGNPDMRSRSCLRLFCISSPDFWPGPLKFSRTDHLASCLLRGRDLGLPSYTKARATLGLPPVTRWQDINPALSRSDGTVRRVWAPAGGAGWGEVQGTLS